MKRPLISAPLLAFPDFDEQFLLYVDASAASIGFGLAQVQSSKEGVIVCNGRGLNEAERNYTTTEREALSLVEGIKRFQPSKHKGNKHKGNKHKVHNSLPGTPAIYL